MAPRLAVYAVPPAGSALAAAADRWLGDAAPPLPGIDRGRQEAITRSPRRYGFHGTLRAPMALRPGAGEADFHHATERLAARSAPVTVPLVPGALDGFLALLPARSQPALDALHAAVMEATEPLRAPLGEADRARRLMAGLTPGQVANLDRWGYPFVMDAFRFHMTLTGRLDPAERAAVAPALAALFAPAIAAPFTLAHLAVFREPKPGARFEEVARYPLAGTPETGP